MKFCMSSKSIFSLDIYLKANQLFFLSAQTTNLQQTMKCNYHLKEKQYNDALPIAHRQTSSCCDCIVSEYTKIILEETKPFLIYEWYISHV